MINIAYILILVMGMAFLPSCAHMPRYQSACEQRYPEFPQMVACLKQSLNQDSRYNSGRDRDSDLAHQYMAYADKLSTEVQDGSISSQDARYLLAKELVNLKSIANARGQQAFQNFLLQQSIINNSQQYNRPMVTNCYRTGWGGYSCTSQ